ncbi:cysteine proteinase-like [Hyposmocoma kahamanoa]|uniref:cysteine proteinase-like n=1 Tax=Hyposmocoma kahamanoa TaxID=1477025 RepID=UPI000E6DA178|nr:cysteine proteinase-like [Hyposmocoma kahamanoa]
MKSVILILLVGTVLVLCDVNIVFDLNKAEELFEQFIKDYNKVYEDDEDKKVHFEAFKKNLEQINKSNQENPDAIFGIDDFTDYTEEEWSHMHGVILPTSSTENIPE